MKKFILCLLLASIAAAGSDELRLTWPEPPLLDVLAINPSTREEYVERYAMIDLEIQNYDKCSDPRSLAEIAVLFDYYLGSANDHNLLSLAASKGEDILPFLYAKMITDNHCTRYNLTEACSARHGDLALVIRGIHEGFDPSGLGSWYENHGCGPKRMDYDIRLLRVAVSAFKNDKGRYPADLQELRDHVEQNYRFDLRIFSPAGTYYQYELKKTGSLKERIKARLFNKEDSEPPPEKQQYYLGYPEWCEQFMEK